MSKSDHARRPRSEKAKVSVRDREWDEYLYGGPRPVLTEQEAIHDQIGLVADLDEDQYANIPGLKQIGPRRVAEWERQLLREIEMEQQREVDEYLDEQEEQRSTHLHADETEIPDYENLDYYATLTIEQAYHHFGSDGWHIENVASRPMVPHKTENYMRVHEAAEVLEVSSAELVRALRLSGEYVSNAMSFIAKPVIQRLYQEALTLDAADDNDSWPAQIERMVRA